MRKYAHILVLYCTAYFLWRKRIINLAASYHVPVTKRWNAFICSVHSLFSFADALFSFVNERAVLYGRRMRMSAGFLLAAVRASLHTCYFNGWHRP